MNELEGPLTVIAHDAGAANHILAWIECEADDSIAAYMAGPAKALWAEKFPDKPLSPSIAAAISRARHVITGSGWSSSVEHDGRKAARAAGISSIAVIDHWVNYRQRFCLNGETVLPDMIWVTDKWARDIARSTFPDLPIRQQRNAYMDGEVTRILHMQQGETLLYVAEPARDEWGGSELGEFQAIDYFMQNRGLLNIPATVPVRLRPHPSDPRGKYDGILRRYSGIRLADEHDLASSLAAARWVAGLQSYAMIVALAAGRTVISTLPPWAPPCVLPHAGIVHLRELAEA